ncbi:MAG: hypothetical protein LBH19_14820 [Dysgonamonadaceae bacterium]|jgi:hypothetical protein|nr:hypothetical protein [Dysgonamonadaceae bacterium]
MYLQTESKGSKVAAIRIFRELERAVIMKDAAASTTGNIGLAAEYPVADRFFVTVGIKYMIDLYDSKYSAFPCTNLGVGYKF